MNKTAGAVPASFSSLEYLRELNLQKNFLTSLPASLFELEYLEYLFVDFNRITGQIPVGITGLTSLKELQLGHNSEFLLYFMQFSSYVSWQKLTTFVKYRIYWSSPTRHWQSC